MKIQAVITFETEVPEGAPEYMKTDLVDSIELGLEKLFRAHPTRKSDGLTFESINVFKIE